MISISNQSLNRHKKKRKKKEKKKDTDLFVKRFSVRANKKDWASLVFTAKLRGK